MIYPLIPISDYLFQMFRYPIFKFPIKIHQCSNQPIIRKPKRNLLKRLPYHNYIHNFSQIFFYRGTRLRSSAERRGSLRITGPANSPTCEVRVEFAQLGGRGFVESFEMHKRVVDVAWSAELSVISKGIYCLICPGGDSSHVLHDGWGWEVSGWSRPSASSERNTERPLNKRTSWNAMKNMFLQARTIRVTILLYPPLPTLPRMTETVERSLAVHLGTNNRVNPLIMDGGIRRVSSFFTILVWKLPLGINLLLGFYPANEGKL